MRSDLARLLIKQLKFVLLFSLFVLCFHFESRAQNPKCKIYKIGEGWAGNSVNTVIFRQNSITSFKDSQFIAWYDPEGFVVLAKRKIGEEKWETKKTSYKGNIADAHNSISTMVDGKGFLHVSWDHHNNELRYAMSKSPGSLELTEKIRMTGTGESKVSYPQFFRQPSGDLIFMYRDGESGKGNLVINKYHLKSGEWEQIHSNLIDGEGLRNAYWQACVDSKGGLHISWVWRETPDVSSNHDMCYAYSKDGGKNWQKSTGERYVLPIKESTAEVISRIPQRSELINQTSITTNKKGAPIIASYWREADSEVPQYHVIYLDKEGWKTNNLNFRKTPFTLSGVGSKRIPISRPVILSGQTGAYLIFRDEERGSKPSVAIAKDLKTNKWEVRDLSEEDLGSWEPSFDTNLWSEKGILDLFVQRVTQIDAEGKADVEPEMVKVLECSANEFIK
jgi:hypothetical protein